MTRPSISAFFPATMRARSPAWSSWPTAPYASWARLRDHHRQRRAAPTIPGRSWRTPLRTLPAPAVTHPRNRGGGALRSGFGHATRSFVFYTDGDAQYGSPELARLLDALAPGGYVNGYKIERHDPLHRVAIGRLYHHTVRTLFRLRIRDVDRDFALLARHVRVRIDSWRAPSASN